MSNRPETASDTTASSWSGAPAVPDVAASDVAAPSSAGSSSNAAASGTGASSWWRGLPLPPGARRLLILVAALGIVVVVLFVVFVVMFIGRLGQAQKAGETENGAVNRPSGPSAVAPLLPSTGDVGTLWGRIAVPQGFRLTAPASAGADGRLILTGALPDGTPMVLLLDPHAGQVQGWQLQEAPLATPASPGAPGGR